MAGPVFWAADDTTDVLRFYRDFAAEAPDELGSVIRLGTVPPLPVIPEDLHWRPAIAVACCYAGAVEDGERAVRALRRFGTPLVDLLAPSPYVAFQGGLDDTVLHGWHYYWKATNLAGLSDDAIAVIADHAYAASSPRSYAAMFHMGGAVARVPHDATAYAGRDVAHNIIIDAVWLPDESGEHAAAETAWARRFLQALQPHRAGGVYVNFLDSDDDSSRVREAYGDQIYRRLAEVKAKYDPDNAFHHNKNRADAIRGYRSWPFSSTRIVSRSVCMRPTVAVLRLAIGRLEAIWRSRSCGSSSRTRRAAPSAPSSADAKPDMGIRLDVPDIARPAPVLGDDPEDAVVEAIGNRVASSAARTCGRWSPGSQSPGPEARDEIARGRRD